MKSGTIIEVRNPSPELHLHHARISLRTTPHSNRSKDDGSISRFQSPGSLRHGHAAQQRDLVLDMPGDGVDWEAECCVDEDVVCVFRACEVHAVGAVVDHLAELRA